MKNLECLCNRDLFLLKYLNKNLGDFIFYKGSKELNCEYKREIKCDFETLDYYNGDSYCGYKINDVEK